MSVERRGEWTFTVYKKPAGLKIDRTGGRPIVLSEMELENLWDGRINFNRYPGLPASVYKRVFEKVCEALERVWIDHVFERAVPEKRKRVVSDITRKPWDVAISKAKEIQAKIDALKKWTEGIDEVMEITKKVKKKK